MAAREAAVLPIFSGLSFSSEPFLQSYSILSVRSDILKKVLFGARKNERISKAIKNLF